MSNTTNANPLPQSAEAWEASISAKQRRRQRRQSLQLQGSVGVILLFAAIVASVLIWSLLKDKGAPKTVSCDTYPQYCVPLSGGASVSANLEAAAGRDLGDSSRGQDGVVRYIDNTTVPTLGNPSAPIHFRVVSSFGCSHCNAYHHNEVQQAISNLVLSGQATLGYVLVNGTSPVPAELASRTALCAGEQGAFWEMSDELFDLAAASGVSAFTMENLVNTADQMGLDAGKLEECVSSGRYKETVLEHAHFSSDEGVASTPTLLVSYDGVNWTIPSLRCYDNMRNLTVRANGN